MSDTNSLYVGQVELMRNLTETERVGFRKLYPTYTAIHLSEDKIHSSYRSFYT